MLVRVAIVWVCFVAGLLLRAGTRRWRWESLAPAPPPADAQPVAVIVPARNEGVHLRHCARGLLSQDYPRLRVIIVNDNSTDATGAVAARIAAANPRARVIDLHELPAGWIGKSNACWQGASAASEPWLCFLDADTVPQPPLLSAAIALAEARGLDMLSLAPLRHLSGFWERLILPAVSLLHRARPGPGAADHPRPAAAAGHFILIRRAVYEAVGGHAAIRGEISDGAAFAKLLQGAGKKVAVLRADHLLRTRLRPGLASVWETLSKNFIERESAAASFLLGAALVIVGWGTLVLPLWAIQRLDPTWIEPLPGPPWIETSALAAFSILAASILLIVAQLIRGRRQGVPYYYTLLFPLGYTLGALIAFDAARWRCLNRVPWKGRLYRPPSR